EDRPEEGEKDLKEINLTEKDMVIGITASGRTPYVLGALNYANSIQAGTSSISCASYSEVSDVAQFPIEIITGPEVVTGSTRMKAGTAQKLVLNMISTAVMIKLGKVYQNYMVDLKASNYKLKIRSINILKEILTINDSQALELLEQANGHVKLALLLGMTDLKIDKAKEQLKQSNGHLRKALEGEENK
ncbi:N-acetylmuramic acid 6-phosphate etherase, partial [Dolosigranulum pigrum]